MKKLLGFLLFAVLVSCTCLSQIPPQTIYVDQNCEGVLPDYTLVVIAADNCEGLTIHQTPVAGTILTYLNPSLIVEIVAVDAFGNTSETLEVPITLIDTIPPTLMWPEGQIAMGDVGAAFLWNNLLDKLDADLSHFVYDQSWTQGIEFSDTTRIEESLRWFTFNHKLSEEQYQKYLTYMGSQEQE